MLPFSSPPRNSNSFLLYHFLLSFTIIKIQDMTIAMSTFYYFIALSSFHFRPFKSFCFSYRLLRSLQSSFMRSNCARTPSRQSGSIFLYSPVRLRIVLLFSFICSDKHTQSIRFCTSLSVS